MSTRPLLTVALVATVVMASTLAFAGPWSDLHAAPQMRRLVVTRNGPSARALLTYRANPTAPAAAEGAPPAAWTEELTCPNAAALTFLSSCTVDDDSRRPAAWPQTLPLTPPE